MALQQEIETAWKEAVKARDPKKDVLSLIKTELKNAAIAARSGGDQSTSLDDDAAQDVLAKMAKQRRESVAEYEKANRQDLVDKEQFELAVIEGYLPAQLSDDELSAIVKDVVAATGASSMKEMGKVMGAAMAKVGGQADGKRVQAAVKQALS